MTFISISVVTTSSHLNDNVEADSPKDAVLQFLDNLELEAGELIVSVVSASVEHDYLFENEVEKLLYTAIPELYVPDYEWVESV